jgi:Flp pilus assembly protein TadD
LQSRLTLLARCHRLVLTHPRQGAAAGLLAAGLAIGCVTWLANRPSATDRRLARGVDEIRAGQLSEGIEDVRVALAADPDSRRARLALAYAYQARGDLLLARAEYEELRQRDDLPLALAGIAYCEAELGHHPFAIAAGKKALEGGLRSPEVLNNLAFSMMRRSLFDEAETLLTEAIGLDSKSSVIFLNRACCRWMQSHQAQQPTPSRALDDICAAIALDPTSPALHVMAARMAAGRVEVDPAAATLLDDSIAAAVRLSCDPRGLARDSFLSRFSSRPVLRELPEQTGPLQPLPEPIRLLPPISDANLAQ